MGAECVGSGMDDLKLMRSDIFACLRRCTSWLCLPSVDRPLSEIHQRDNRSGKAKVDMTVVSFRCVVGKLHAAAKSELRAVHFSTLFLRYQRPHFTVSWICVDFEIAPELAVTVTV